MTVPDANAGRGRGAAPGAGKPAEGDSASPGAAEAKPGAEADPGAGEAKPGAQTQPDPCEPAAQGGYLGADNQCIRVMVTAYDAATNSAKIVWAFDNTYHMFKVVVQNDDDTREIVELTKIAGLEVLRQAPAPANPEQSGDRPAT